MTWLHVSTLAAFLQLPIRLDECLRSGMIEARWELPRAWREVSGLALSADGRLFLHGDEHGRIAALDIKTGRLLASYELGSVSPRGDFEDIAIAGDEIYLITAAGRLYRAGLPPPERSDGSLAYSVYETKVDRWCEVEGLAFDPGDNILLIGCKAMKTEDRAPAVFRWSLAEQRLADPDRVVLATAPALPLTREAALRPSALGIDPATGAGS
jgi:hypothetical protein